MIGKNNLDELRRLEATVFGETERGSAVVVRLHGNLSKMANYDLDRNQQGQQLLTGHNYFYYSTRLGSNLRTPFTPGEADATLTLMTRLGVANADDTLRKAAASAWLLTHLGGLGMRARRCGGSLQAASGSLSDLPEFIVSAQTAADLQTHLATGLKQISAMMGSLQSPPSDFGILHPDVCRIWVIADQSPWQTWKAAVNAMGNAMKTFRAGQPDRNRTNAIFGLPIHHAPYDIKQLAKPAKRGNEVNPKIPNQLEENQKPFRDKEGVPLSAFQRLGGSFERNVYMVVVGRIVPSFHLNSLLIFAD